MVALEPMGSLHIYIAGIWNQKKNTEKVKTVWFRQFRRPWEAYWFIYGSLQFFFICFPRTVPEEEREAKFFRILTCSLLALKKLLSMLPKKEMQSLEEKLMSLLSQNKFWKYSKHSVPQVTFYIFSSFWLFLVKDNTLNLSKY